MLNFFKKKEEKEFQYLLENVENYKNSLYILLTDKPKTKKTIENIRTREWIKENISCYNTELLFAMDEYFNKNKLITDKNEERYDLTKHWVQDYINKNIKFWTRRLEKAKLIFTNKWLSKTDVNVGYNWIWSTLYYDDILDLLSPKNNIPEEMITVLFLNIIKQIWHYINSYNYKNIFKKIINHKNFNKKLLWEFMGIQMSDPKWKGYVEWIKYGDDIDLINIKREILSEKFLSANDLDLTILCNIPYITLWEILLTNYLLNPYLLVQFIDWITQNTNVEEKTIIINFINSHLNNFIKFPELRYKIDNYIHSYDNSHNK